MNEANGLREGIRQLERRMDTAERERKELWQQMGRTENSVGVMVEQIAGIRDDIRSLNLKYESDHERQKKEREGRSKNRTLVAIAVITGSFAVFAALISAVALLLSQ